MKAKVKVELKKLSFNCVNCNKDVEIEAKEASFGASSGECELCGSHGSVTVYVSCPECKKSYDIEVYEW